MALCAPGPNSYRRFRAEAYVPLHPTWSINNRGSAIRVPASDPDNLRIEHRLAGADANPVPGARLGAGGHAAWPGAQTRTADGAHGQRLRRKDGDPLPITWPQAIDRFARSEFARICLGEKFVQPVHRRETRRDGGIQFLHHATGDRAIPGTAITRTHVMNAIDPSNYYYASTPRRATVRAAAWRRARGRVRHRWRHLGACRPRCTCVNAASAWSCSKRKHLGFGGSGRSGGQSIFGYACEMSTLEKAVGAADARRMWDVARSRAGPAA